MSALTDSMVNVYQGLGAIYSAQHQALYPGAGAWDTQTYVIDALGNQRTIKYQSQGLQDPTASYAVHTGRLFKRSYSGVPNDTMTYDAAGNEAMRRMTKFIPNGEGNGTIEVADSTVESYDVDGHLRALGFRVRRITGAGTLLPVNGPHNDTTRYDALGRRIWARTVYGDASCGSQCTELSSVVRFVWDGSQILGEIRDRGGVSATDAQMEDDAPIALDSLPCTFSAEVPCDSTPTSRVRGTYSARVGRVAYVHSGGIDQPILVIRRDYGGDSTFFGDIDIYPHANWRGETDQVTFFNGRGDYGSNQTHPVVDLPAKNELGFHQTKESAAGPPSWNGSLLAQQRDASGLMYMRNRYYDPQTGRFTQEDPIGIAGGMNLYGFATGDAVNYSDPFGLLGCDRDHPEDCSLGDVWHNFLQGVGDTFTLGSGSDTGPGWKTGVFVGLVGQALGARAPVGRGVSSGIGAAEAGAADADAAFSPSTRRAIRSLEGQVEKHLQKLEDYRANPDAFDNQAILKNASPEVRERIINGRIRHLENEIQNFRNQIEMLRNPHIT